MLSDGEDTSSLVSFDEVLELAKRSETAIYSIGLRSRGPERARGSFNESDFVLRQLAQETGGKAYFARVATELTGIYEQISDELSSQYMVGYTLEEPQTRRRLAPHRRACPRTRRHRAHEAGLLRTHFVSGECKVRSAKCEVSEWGSRRRDDSLHLALALCTSHFAPSHRSDVSSRTWHAARSI